jgi:hypothetical protein
VERRKDAAGYDGPLTQVGEGVMGQGKPAKKRDNGHRAGDRKILEGDIVVTAVAGQ